MVRFAQIAVIGRRLGERVKSDPKLGCEPIGRLNARRPLPRPLKEAIENRGSKN